MNKQGGAPRYCVQEHDAVKAGLHWDLRLQVNSVMFSWAIPKGIPEQCGIKRLALRVPDHTLAWAKFEGVIPAGEYGAGTVKLWDVGYYIPVEITKGKMVFEIHGRKLKGVWAIAQMRGQETKWFLEKIGELKGDVNA